MLLRTSLFVVCSRLRLNKSERLLRLTESFAWEDQTTRDSQTGHRTLAGWIPRVQKVFTYVSEFAMYFHTVQPGVRIFAFREILFSAWYHFDTVSSPGYDLAILTQVIRMFADHSGRAI
jgi:hypothetical protein